MNAEKIGIFSDKKKQAAFTGTENCPANKKTRYASVCDIKHTTSTFRGQRNLHS